MMKKRNFILRALNSVKGKLFITVTVGIVLFFTVLLVNNNYSDRMIRESLDMTIENMSDLTGEYMDLRSQKSDNIADATAVDQDVITLSSIYLAESSSYRTLGEIRNSVKEKLSYIALVNEEIDSIYLYYDSRHSFIDSEGNITGTDDPEIMDWINENTGWKAASLWKDYYSNPAGKSYVSMMYRLDYLNTTIRTPVYLGINFERNAILEFLDKIKLTRNASAALVNLNDNVYIYDADISTVIDLKTQVRKHMPALRAGRTATTEIVNLGKNILRYVPLASGRGGIVHVIPEDDMQPYRLNLKPFILMLAVFLCLGFMAILFYLINADIDKPIKLLIRHMKKLEAGRFSDKIEEDRVDEFGSVYTAYNSMTVEIEKLIQELYQEKLVKREMELKILQEKINPHFLYNTLDTINWIAMENKVEDISKMVIALSTMYRKTFNRGRDLISIDDVMTSISCYLDIQQIRYGESFDYEIDCAEDTLNLEILNLIIQTLVENSIIHGIEGMTENGKIVIKSKRENGNLVVEVSDNGMGMDAEKLDLIRASIASSGMESESGLRNVQKRIKLYYGNEYGVSIKSEKGSGTTVRVVIPAIEVRND